MAGKSVTGSQAEVPTVCRLQMFVSCRDALGSPEVRQRLVHT